MKRLLVAVLLLLSLGGCTRVVTRTVPSPSPSPLPWGVHEVIPQIPWCTDQAGHSPVWPCKWDSRTRETVNWDIHSNPIAVYVRASEGCPKNLDTQGVPWSCYWRPEDRA